MLRRRVFRLIFTSFSALAILTATVLIADIVSRTHGIGVEKQYNVLLLTVESFRADAISDSLTPSLLDAVEHHGGIRFDHHRAVSAWTVPNIIALLTGVHPVYQGVHSRDQRLRDPVSLNLGRDGDGAMHSVQAFALIDSYANLGLIREVGETFEGMLARMRRSSNPMGIWYHFLDTHLPHQPTLPNGDKPKPDAPGFDAFLSIAPAANAAEFERRKAVSLLPAVPVSKGRFMQSDQPWVRAYYDSEIRYFDHWFADFFRQFLTLGLDRNTVLIITADHGEELAEQGRVGHASTTQEAVLRDEILNLPLFIWTPDEGQRRALLAWRESQVMTDHIDIGASLAAFSGNPVENRADVDGEPTVNGETALQGRELTGPVHRRRTMAFTSAAGFSEPDPKTTRYFLLSQEEDGVRDIVRLGPDGTLRETVSPNEIGSDRLNTLRAVMKDIVFPSTRTDSEAPGSQADHGIAWVWPPHSGVFQHADVVGHQMFEWDGDANATYILEYRAGPNGNLLSGEVAVQGNKYVFGAIDQSYWDTYLKPCGHLRLRVRTESGLGSSDWLSIRVE